MAEIKKGALSSAGIIGVGMSKPQPTKLVDVQEQMLIEALKFLPGKVIGWHEDNGVYNLELLCSGGTNEPDSDYRISQSKFVLHKGSNENYLRFSYVSMQLKHLMGEILTTVEASIQNEKQCDAVKSIIKNYFHNKIDWTYEMCGTPESEQDFLMNPHQA